MTIDWDSLYRREYVSVPDCWKECGGYCCNNFLAGELSLPESDKVVVPFLPGEYAHHVAAGGFPQPGMTVTQHYVLPDGQPWDVHFLRCSAKGKCNANFVKPLVCRIYPYFPVVDLDGGIVDFEYCSLIDLFHPEVSVHPCYIVREEGHAVQERLRVVLAEALVYPEIVFAFAMFKRITDALRRALPGTFDAKAEPGERRKFLRAFQWQIYSRKPWITPEFRKEVSILHAAMVKRHGRLLLS